MRKPVITPITRIMMGQRKAYREFVLFPNYSDDPPTIDDWVARADRRTDLFLIYGEDRGTIFTHIASANDFKEILPLQRPRDHFWAQQWRADRDLMHIPPLRPVIEYESPYYRIVPTYLMHKTGVTPNRVGGYHAPMDALRMFVEYEVEAYERWQQGGYFGRLPKEYIMTARQVAIFMKEMGFGKGEAGAARAAGLRVLEEDE